MPPILYDMLSWPLDGASDPRTAAVLLWVLYGVVAIAAGFHLAMRLAGRFRTGTSRALFETAVLAATLSVGIMVWLGLMHLSWLFYGLPLPLATLAYALWSHYRSGTRPRNGQNCICTRYLKIALDHAEGTFDGEILKGTYSGLTLSRLTLAELRILQAEVSADPESVSVLNAYMDHARAGGRHRQTGSSQDTGHSGSGDRQRRQPGGAMSEEEARNLLGLAQGASPQEIKSAHRRLIKQVHPDHGGTDYLAHKINLARELLLGKTAETADSG